jgi:2-polyprenyl-3-methyl-5-hydroxy-6-metoxy-1,4-benzoquinol methylase
MKLETNSVFSTFYNNQLLIDYENSHKPRLDHLIEDLKLNTLENKKIADIGCGAGFLYKRLKPEIQKNYTGYDGSDLYNLPFTFNKVDLDNFSVEDTLDYDYVFCFETLEHLTNPYNCLIQIKKMLKEDHFLYLSIPHLSVTHNTIYPGLIYPIENFIQFLNQMAFEIIDHKIHSKAWEQHVFVLKNKNWNFSKMLFIKNEEKLKNIAPHVAVNL